MGNYSLCLPESGGGDLAALFALLAVVSQASLLFSLFLYAQNYFIHFPDNLIALQKSNICEQGFSSA